eukprot:8510682-Alexandrium_andersonii.AAC.1
MANGNTADIVQHLAEEAARELRGPHALQGAVARWSVLELSSHTPPSEATATRAFQKMLVASAAFEPSTDRAEHAVHLRGELDVSREEGVLHSPLSLTSFAPVCNHIGVHVAEA